ncbi:hypothetical protein BK026_05990 [Alteromonas sp. V450]|uniref:hypothetical protein n=1 Tax=Alteromonas sp. V450 TaxID=1912139 RepID=UPI0008FF1E74|nr:hypothetical protein [Alteromonas sp. V450]OJF68374.1 hypothetical protein BK026_05990 [Alteromonas sp. V450]
MSLFANHKNVAPLYQTLTSYVQSNIRSSEAGASFQLGNVNGGAVFSTARDNLDDIASLLTTQTKQRSFNVSVPLAQM